MLCGLVTLIAWCLSVRAVAAGVQYVKQVVEGATLHTVYVDLHDPWVQVVPAVATDVPNNRLSFSAFMDTYQPLAQCTGTFFDFRSGEAIGDLVINGQLIPPVSAWAPRWPSPPRMRRACSMRTRRASMTGAAMPV